MFDGQGGSDGIKSERISLQPTNSPPPLKQKYHLEKKGVKKIYFPRVIKIKPVLIF